jgi:hypothetical protein
MYSKTVHTETGFRSETLLTRIERTMKRFQGSMTIPLQMTGSMGIFMFSHISNLTEAFAADLTLIRFFSSMHSNMSHQYTFRLEKLPTFWINALRETKKNSQQRRVTIFDLVFVL